MLFVIGEVGSWGFSDKGGCRESVVVVGLPREVTNSTSNLQYVVRSRVREYCVYESYFRTHPAMLQWAMEGLQRSPMLQYPVADCRV